MCAWTVYHTIFTLQVPDCLDRFMYTKRRQTKGCEAIFTDRRSVYPETEFLHGSQWRSRLCKKTNNNSNNNNNHVLSSYIKYIILQNIQMKLSVCSFRISRSVLHSLAQQIIDFSSKVANNNCFNSWKNLNRTQICFLQWHTVFNSYIQKTLLVPRHCFLLTIYPFFLSSAADKMRE